MVPDDAPTIGELFPADDEVAQWVFSLSVVVDDLLHIQRLQKTEIGEREDARTMLFLQRMLTVRLYEARRVVSAVDTRPAIAAFLSPVPPPLDTLRTYYLPAEASAVDDMYGLLRHNSVHFMWPGSAELTKLLRICARLPARSRVTKEDGVDIQWVPTVAGMLTLGDASGPTWTPKFKERGELEAAILQAWVLLYIVVLAHYAQTRGIPFERFTYPPDEPAAEAAG